MKANQMGFPKKINPNARTAIDSILREYELTLDPMRDFDLLAGLHTLGERMTHPGTLNEQFRLLDTPIKCGGLNLYRLTMGAVMWLEWFELAVEDETSQSAAVIYAFANCRKEGWVDDERLWDATKAERIVRRWCGKSKINVDALTRAIGELLPEPSFIPQDGAKAGYGHVIATLVAEIGHSPDFWINEMSADQTSEILAGIARVKMQEHGDGKTPNPYDPFVAATREFHYYKLHVIAELTRRNNAEAAA